MIAEGNLELLNHLFESPLYHIEEPGEINFFSLAEKKSETTRLIFLLKDKSSEQASDATLDLLIKMVDWKKGMDLKREEVVIVNIARQKISFRQLTNQFHSANLIALGVEPDEIGLQTEFKLNRTFRFMGVNCAFTSSLEKLLQQDAEKKKFFSDVFFPMFRTSNPTTV